MVKRARNGSLSVPFPVGEDCQTGFSEKCFQQGTGLKVTSCRVSAALDVLKHKFGSQNTNNSINKVPKRGSGSPKISTFFNGVWWW